MVPAALFEGNNPLLFRQTPAPLNDREKTPIRVIGIPVLVMRLKDRTPRRPRKELVILTAVQKPPSPVFLQVSGQLSCWHETHAGASSKSMPRLFSYASVRHSLEMPSEMSMRACTRRSFPRARPSAMRGLGRTWRITRELYCAGTLRLPHFCQGSKARPASPGSRSPTRPSPLSQAELRKYAHRRFRPV